MIMPEILKMLCNLQVKTRDNGGANIHDITSIHDGEYGYVLALTSFRPGVHGDLLSAKLAEMNGKQILPDLWLFGPCMKQGSEQTPAAESA